MKNNQNEFETNIRLQLNESLDSIDKATQSRLNNARNKALSAANKSQFNIMNWFVPLISTAAVALLLIAILPTNFQHDIDLNLATSDEFIMVSEMEDIVLYDDIEFYQWLESVDNNS